MHVYVTLTSINYLKISINHNISGILTTYKNMRNSTTHKLIKYHF